MHFHFHPIFTFTCLIIPLVGKSIPLPETETKQQDTDSNTTSAPEISTPGENSTQTNGTTQQEANLPPQVISANLEDDMDPKLPPLTENDKAYTAAVAYEHIDRDKVDKLCNHPLGTCQASIRYQLVCGSDKNVYKNIGVLACAQSCKKVKLSHFGPCENAKQVTKPRIPRRTTTSRSIVAQQTFGPMARKVMEQRIRDRKNRHQHFYGDWQLWCVSNPDKCTGRNREMYDPTFFLIQSEPFKY